LFINPISAAVEAVQDDIVALVISRVAESRGIVMGARQERSGLNSQAAFQLRAQSGHRKTDAPGSSPTLLRSGLSSRRSNPSRCWRVRSNPGLTPQARSAHTSGHRSTVILAAGPTENAASVAVEPSSSEFQRICSTSDKGETGAGCGTKQDTLRPTATWPFL
jgi:hypothetical protein